MREAAVEAGHGAPEQSVAAPQAAPAEPVAATPALLSRSIVTALQHAVGNRTVAQLVGAPSPPTGPTGRAPRGIQRDAAAKEAVGKAVDQPDPDKKGDGFKEAFKLLNGLAMFDMLSTLLALNRSGHFAKLDANWGSAVGVNTPRLQLAFSAVRAKGVIDAEAFVRANGGAMMAFPLDQRQNIINFLEPGWFDALKAVEDAEPLIAAVRGHAVFKALDPADQTLTEEIITEARKAPEKLVYYVTKLKLLFDTPRRAAAATGAENRAATGAATKAEAKRVSAPGAAKNVGMEERKAGAKTRKWTPIPGKSGGGTYYVDKTDATDIVVRATVFLQPKGGGKPADVAAIKQMEDGIEKAASSPGYTVDLIFVKAPTADSFTVDVDTDKWQVSTNWSGGEPSVFAHELHHLMHFELDRYDYIESHADNVDMDIPDRLYWFRQEMTKPPNFNDPTSIMNANGHPNDDDVCRVAELDLASCIARRQKKAAAGKP